MAIGCQARLGARPDYVEGMWRILQHNGADDFVLATGETHAVREFVELAFAEVGVKIDWKGSGIDEEGIEKSGKTVVKVDPRYSGRPKLTYCSATRPKLKKCLDGRRQRSLKN